MTKETATDPAPAKTLAKGDGWKIEETPQGLAVHKNFYLASESPKEWKAFSKAFKKFAGARLENYATDKQPAQIVLPRFFAGLLLDLWGVEAQGRFAQAVFEFYFAGKEPLGLSRQEGLFFETCKPFLQKQRERSLEG